MGDTIPVIVLNWKGLADTKACVESLLNQSYGNLHIFLADNGSGQDETTALREAYADHRQITLIFFAENLGFTAAHNRVFEEYIVGKEYRWMALLNNDAEAEGHWLEHLASSAEKHQVGALASKMIQYHDRSTMDNAGHAMLNTGEIIPRGAGKSIDDFYAFEETLGACAGAAIYRVDLLEQIGFFDPHFQTGYEDAELGLRIFLAGERTCFHPDALVYHKMGQSINKIRDAVYLSGIQQHIFYTWFKLMPSSILWWNLPAMCFKYSMVLFIDILFLRFRFLRVMSHALWASWKNRKTIRTARKAYRKKDLQTRSFGEIQKHLTHFLWFDIQRFVYFVLLNRTSKLESDR